MQCVLHVLVWWNKNRIWPFLNYFRHVIKCAVLSQFRFLEYPQNVAVSGPLQTSLL